MKNYISTRSIYDTLFFKRATKDVHGLSINKSLMQKLILISTTLPANFKGRIKNPVRDESPILRTIDFFFFIYGEKYDEKEKKHQRWLKEIEKNLDVLSKNWHSMYGDNNQIFKKFHHYDYPAYQYIAKQSASWHKLSYTIPNLFTMTISDDHRRLWNWNFPVVMVTAMIALASRGGISFTERQLDVLFGINTYDLKKACKYLGIEPESLQTPISWFEKNEYELNDSDLYRGYYFTDSDIDKVEDYMKQLKVNINWFGIFQLRIWLYENVQKAEKSWFKERNKSIEVQLDKAKINDVRHWTDETFKKAIDFQSMKNSVSCFKMNTTDSDEFNSQKSRSFAEKYVNGSKRGKKKSLSRQIHEVKKQQNKYNRDMNNMFLRIGMELESSSSGYCQLEKGSSVMTNDVFLGTEEIEAITNSKSFGKVCIIVNKLFEEVKQTTHTITIWKAIKNQLLTLDYKNEQLKQFVIDELSNIKRTADIFKSPMFCDDYHMMSSWSVELLNEHANIQENILQRKIQKKTMSQLEFDELITKLKSSDSHETFSIMKTSLIHERNLNEDQKSLIASLEWKDGSDDDQTLFVTPTFKKRKKVDLKQALNQLKH